MRKFLSILLIATIFICQFNVIVFASENTITEQSNTPTEFIGRNNTIIYANNTDYESVFANVYTDTRIQSPNIEEYKNVADDFISNYFEKEIQLLDASQYIDQKITILIENTGNSMLHGYVLESDPYTIHINYSSLDTDTLIHEFQHTIHYLARKNKAPQTIGINEGMSLYTTRALGISENKFYNYIQSFIDNEIVRANLYLSSNWNYAETYMFFNYIVNLNGGNDSIIADLLNDSSIEDIEDIVSYLSSRNIKINGELITMDNLYEDFLKNIIFDTMPGVSNIYSNSGNKTTTAPLYKTIPYSSDYITSYTSDMRYFKPSASDVTLHITANNSAKFYINTFKTNSNYYVSSRSVINSYTMDYTGDTLDVRLDNLDSTSFIQITPVVTSLNSTMNIGSTDNFNWQITGMDVNAEFILNSDSTLKDLKNNGITIQGFNPSVTDYSIELPYGTASIPTTTATVNNSLAKAVITKATSMTDNTVVLVTAENGTTTTYTIRYTIAQRPLSIVSVDAPNNITINHGETVEIPTQLTAHMDDGSTKLVNVNWSGDFSTTIDGSREIYGIADGYAPVITFIFTVNPVDPIIVSVATPNDITINHGDAINIPTQLTATLNNRNTKVVNVSWTGDISNVVDGSRTISGTVDGYSPNITFMLTVNPIIISVDAPNNITIDHGKALNIPSQLTAHMSDNSSKLVSVTWSGDISNISDGSRTISGTVSGYSSNITFMLTVNPLKVTKLIASKNLIAINKGEVANVNLISTMSDGSTEDVNAKATWKIDNSVLATVEKGKVTGKGSGNTTVHASYDKFNIDIPVVVTDDTNLKAITASSKSIKMDPNSTANVTIIATYNKVTDKTDVTNFSEWSSNNTNVAIVSNGLITCKGIGKAAITVKFKNKVTTINVECMLRTLEASKTKLSLLVGNATNIDLFAVFGNKTRINVTEDAIWTSDNTEVVEVDNGNITCVGMGKANITVTYGGKSIKIIFDNAIKSLSSNVKSIKSSPENSTDIIINATFKDGSKKDVTSEAIITSENPAIASIDNGKIICKGIGKTNINVSYGGKSIKITFNSSIKSLKATPRSVSLKSNSTSSIKLEAIFIDGAYSDITEDATYTTNNSLVEVSNGIITIKGSVTKKTSVTIKASYSGSTTSIKITVNP